MGYLKNELSKKSRYHLSKHRYLELKHYCLQYPEWRDRVRELTDICSSTFETKGSNWPTSETERLALERIRLKNRIELVEKTAMETDQSLWFYILQGVTEDRTYTYLRNVMDIPCGKNMYYDRYRAFFWRLSIVHDN